MTSTDTDGIVHIDFANTKIGNPHNDLPSRTDGPFLPTGCISPAMAAAAERMSKARRSREFIDILDAEMQRRDKTDAEMTAEFLLATERKIEGCISDLYSLSRSLNNVGKGEVGQLLGSLNHLHMRAGSILEDLEAMAGRKFVPPHCEYGTLNLKTLGGYSTCPKTGREMCPFSDYREPVPPKKS